VDLEESTMTAFASSAGNDHDRPDPEESFGEFIFAGDVPIGRIASFYGFPVPNTEKAKPLAKFVSDHLHGRPRVGDGVRVEAIELVVQDVEDNHITRVGLELDPPARLTRPSLGRTRRAGTN
jgi:NhaP-type Na+/H+ and K+/H+ antiporter